MLCNIFKKQASYIWKLIEKSRKVNFQLKETSLTDFNMLMLKLNGNGSVITYPFNQREEANNGADWEWWFVNQNSWLGFRVQAKVIDTNSDSFIHLHYAKRSKKTKKVLKIQCNSLIKNAAISSTIPIYCFYIHTDKGTIASKPNPDFYGCSLLGAFEVQKLYKKKQRKLADIETKVVGWHSLVCFGSKSKTVNTIEIFAKKHLIQNESEKEKDYITNKPPEYVKEIFENGVSNKIQLDLGGVMISVIE